MGVIKGANVMLPHHRGLVLVYLMENKTPFVFYVIKWQGCNYIIKDNKSLNEKTQGHPNMKRKSKLMQVGWE
jgi:hypothetical protein